MAPGATPNGFYAIKQLQVDIWRVSPVFYKSVLTRQCKLGAVWWERPWGCSSFGCSSFRSAIIKRGCYKYTIMEYKEKTRQRASDTRSRLRSTRAPNSTTGPWGACSIVTLCKSPRMVPYVNHTASSINRRRTISEKDRFSAVPH